MTSLGDVQVTLNYTFPDPDGEELFTHVVQPIPPKRWTNVVPNSRNVVVHNVRGREGHFSLDVCGFEFLKHTSTEKNLLDEKVVKTRYYKEIEQLLKDNVGCKRVLIIGHTIRRSLDLRKTDGLQSHGPSYTVHVDRTFEAAIAQVRESFGANAEHLLKGRVQIINVWRPIGSTVYHEPLALADWRTISLDDLIPLRVVCPDKDTHVFVGRYNKSHTWYYLSEQTPSEVTFIKCFDSNIDGRARFSLHSAFRDVRSPSDAPQRQSIEVSALVFDQ